VAIRNLVLPVLSGGALLLGYVAFFRRPKRQPALASNGPSTLREAGLLAIGAGTARGELAAGRAVLLRDLRLAEPIEARFLGHLTDALSPFGAERGHEPAADGARFDRYGKVLAGPALNELDRMPPAKRQG
jgi:hypothetical protein